MKLRKHVAYVTATLAVAILVFGVMLFRKLDLPPPPPLKEGGWSEPEIVFDEATGMASTLISVLDYNIAGLPFPIACGKKSRLTDAEGERILIACDRAGGARVIGDALAVLRARGLVPDVLLLQEAFIPASAEIPRRGGYPNWVNGPGPMDTGPRYSERANASFISDRSFWKGEKWGKRQPSGLLIASNFLIAEHFNFPFYEWECAGFDCLANKGVMLARLRIPGVPGLLEVVTTHYNAKKASGVPLERANAAHALQVDATGDWNMVLGTLPLARSRCTTGERVVLRWAPFSPSSCITFQVTRASTWDTTTQSLTTARRILVKSGRSHLD